MISWLTFFRYKYNKYELTTNFMNKLYKKHMLYIISNIFNACYYSTTRLFIA